MIRPAKAEAGEAFRQTPQHLATSGRVQNCKTGLFLKNPCGIILLGFFQ